MAERDVPILQDTERVWIIVILLGFLWLGPPLPGHVWIVLAATALLTGLLLISFCRDLLRRPVGFVPVVSSLTGLVVTQIVYAGIESKAFTGARTSLQQLLWAVVEVQWQDLAGWALEVVPALVGLAVGAVLLVLAVRWFLRLLYGQMQLPGASFDLTARGLFIPLLLCLMVSVWGRKAGVRGLTIPAGSAALLLFLFHFYAYWPRRRWLSRWVLLVAIALTAPSGSPTVYGDIVSPGFYPCPAVVPAAVGGFFWTIYDFARSVPFLGDPHIRAFFFGGPPTAWGEEAPTQFLKGLMGYEWAGSQLSPIVALALSPLLALRLVAGESRRRAFAYFLWCILFSLVTAPLWSTLVDPFLYRPFFLGETCYLWLTQGLPLQVVLSVSTLWSLPLAAALSGRMWTGQQQPLATTDSLPSADTGLPLPIAGRPKRLLRRLFDEKFWIPALAFILVLSGLLGGICALVTNACVGTFHDVLEPRPGQTAAGPVLWPLFSKPETYRMTNHYSKGFDLHEYPPVVLAQPYRLPDTAECDRLTSECRRPEIRKYLEAFERAAEADVCGWKYLTPENRIAIPGFINTRESARILAARSAVAMAHEDWNAAFRDIRCLVRFGTILGSEGTLVQRMIGVAVLGIGSNRAAFLAVRFSPKEQLRPLLSELRGLDPWVQRLADMEAIEEAEPFFKWPARFVFPSFALPGYARAMTVDKATVAKFRLLLLGCGARIHLAEQGHLPTTCEELRPYLGGFLPLDPFTNKEFEAEFSAERVRFSTPASEIPPWFDTQGTKFLPVLTVKANGEVSEE